MYYEFKKMVSVLSFPKCKAMKQENGGGVVLEFW